MKFPQHAPTIRELEQIFGALEGNIGGGPIRFIRKSKLPPRSGARVACLLDFTAERGARALGERFDQRTILPTHVAKRGRESPRLLPARAHFRGSLRPRPAIMRGQK